MPFYDHLCSNCNEEFEDFYSAISEPPTKCPLCNEEGHVQRLIAGPFFGSVKLEGHELQQHIKTERTKLKHQMKSDENLRANVIGESKYEKLVSSHEKSNK